MSLQQKQFQVKIKFREGGGGSAPLGPLPGYATALIIGLYVDVCGIRWMSSV